MTQTLLITGASSGIGEALALHYAAPGTHLSLSGRDADRLADVATRCERKGATVSHRVLDVTDRDEMARWIAEQDDRTPVDLLIANAGISGGTGGVLYGETVDEARRIFAVNVDGVFNTVEPIIPRMIARGRGQIALMSSLASFHGWPGAPAYSASKAAVRTYGEALRGALAPSGVKVNVICPGFVISRMTAVNPYNMPFLMPAEQAARIIEKGLNANRGRISFPLPTAALSWLTAALPDCIVQRILRRLPAKPAQS